MKRQLSNHNLFVRILLSFASGLSSVVYFFIFKIFRYRYSVVIENLSKSFPEKSSSEIDAYARNYYRHIGDLVVEPLLFISVSDATRKKFANYTNPELAQKFYDRRSNIVALASHCGNWEYLIHIPRVLKFKVFTAYTPLSNKVMDRYLLKLRSSYGVTLFEKKYFFRNALAILKKRNDPGMVVVIADQRPGPGSAKNFVDFFKQSTQVQIGAERLATASGAAVLFLECVKKSQFHYDYTFHEITDDAESCMPMKITENYYRMLEQNIKRSPAHWLWSHKRWKPIQENKPETSLIR